MKIFLPIFFLMILSSGKAQTESIFVDYNPFEFTGPRDSEFSCFSVGELIQLKTQKIDYVVITVDDWVVGDKIKYSFDDDFYLSKQDYYSNKKKESILVHTTRYIIDSTYRLIAKEREVIGVKLVYDSMAYDKIGRLIYKEHTISSWSKKSKAYVFDSTSKLEVIESNNKNVVLLNKADSSRSYINNINELYRFESSDRVDSLSVEVKEDSSTVKSFWYKYKSGSGYKIGLRQEYKNELLVTETKYYYYKKYGTTESNMHYVYDKNQKMVVSYRDDIYSSPPNEKKVYIYKNGLVNDITHIEYKSNKQFHFSYVYNITLR